MSKTKDINYLIKLLGKKRYPIETDITESPMSEVSNETKWRPNDPIILDDNYESLTTFNQEEFHETLRQEYQQETTLKFYIDLHVQYLNQALTSRYPSQYKSLDANHTWMLYWLTNGLALLNQTIPPSMMDLVKYKINSCIVDDGLGGISGGKNQMGHVASTYAAVLALILIEDFLTLSRIRTNLYKWFMHLKNENGSFKMHENGEYDTRSTYCVLVVSTLLNIKTEELTKGVNEWLKTCQTYEGGFSNIPMTEAHGGYTFCAVASYLLLHQTKEKIVSNMDFEKLLEWSAQRQGNYEGGFNGRTNKLIDSCYSFWIGGTFPILETLSSTKNLFQKDALKHYLLKCCQNDVKGGFIDKPGKGVDFYHTNYALSGLSIIENEYHLENDSTCFAFGLGSSSSENELNVAAVHPVFGIPIDTVITCKEHFY